MEFAGIDLKVTPENEVYCFEVNPSPAFSYYENNTGQPIAEGLAHRLMEADGSSSLHQAKSPMSAFRRPAFRREQQLWVGEAIAWCRRKRSQRHCHIGQE